MKRFLAVLLVMVLIPYVTTLAWTGRLGDGNIAGIDEDGGVWLGSAGNGAGDSVDGVGSTFAPPAHIEHNPVAGQLAV